MFALGNATFAYGVRSDRERSFEEANGETEVGRRLLAPEPCPLLPLARKPNPKLKQRPPRALFCLKQDNSCCYTRYSSDNNCNIVSSNSCKSARFFSRCILLPFYRNSSPGTTRFLGKRTVSYKRAVALRNSRLVCRLPLFFCHAYGYLPNCRTSPRFGWYQIILLGTEACVGASNSPRVVTQLHPSWESNPRPLRHMCCTTTKLRSAVNPDKICYIKIFSVEQNYVCLLLCPRPLGGALSDDAVWRLSVCRVHRA